MIREVFLWGRDLGEGGGAQWVLFNNWTFESREADDGQVPVSPGNKWGSRELERGMPKKKVEKTKNKNIMFQKQIKTSVKQKGKSKSNRFRWLGSWKEKEKVGEKNRK